VWKGGIVKLCIPVVTALVAAGSVCSPLAFASVDSETNKPTLNSWYVGGRRAHERVWNYVTQSTNQSGRTLLFTNQYVELETGLHYAANGQWNETQELIEATPGKAVAQKGPHKATFSNNLRNGIEVVTPDGLVLRSQPLGISYDDGEHNILIAELKDCVGEIVPPNQIIYRDAFTDFEADICYTYTKAGVEQDLILREQPPEIPEGMNPDTTRIQLLTEFFDPPRPKLTSLRVEDADGVELPDQIVQFGNMSMGAGRAFTTGADLERGLRETRVGKQFLNLEGRDFLIEEIPVSSIAPDLGDLPKADHASTHVVKHSSQMVVSAKRMLPRRQAGALDQNLMLVASGMPRTKGYLVDYAIVSSVTNFTFDGATTYVVSNSVTLSGAVTFQGGAIVKLARGASLNASGSSLSISTVLNGWRPVILTASDDNTAGETISGSTGSPTGYYGAPALGITRPTSVTVTNFRILYAQEAVRIVGPGTPTTATTPFPLYDFQFVNCRNGVTVSQTNASLRNVLFANVATNLVTSNYCNISVENGTFGTSTCAVARVYSGGSNPNVYFTNSIFANVQSPTVGSTVGLVANYCGFYNSSGTYGSLNSQTVTTSPFQTMWAGNYYLASGSSFVNAGTRTLDSTLLTMLAQLTTGAPLLLSNTVDTAVSTSVTLSPRVTRNSGVPDLGYHYKPIDYVAWNFMMTNAPLVLTNGVVIGVCNDTAFYVLDGVPIYCEGTPLNMNRFVDYSIVQEVPVTLGSRDGQCVIPYRYKGVASVGRFRFTEYSFMRSENSLYAFVDSWSYSALDVSDCVFRQGSVYLQSGTSSISFKNNLFENSYFNISTDTAVGMYNNTFNKGSIEMDVFSIGLGTMNDNVFQGCSSMMDYEETVTHVNNAYVGMATNVYTYFPSGPTDKVLTSISWQTGTLGSYYLPTSSTLINAGSRTAPNAGLYHYTTQTAQTKEAATQVDIGYHYVALTSALPTDTDGDGMSDYYEDSNGNGTFNAGVDASNLTNALYSTAGDGIPDAWRMKYFGTLDINANTGASDDYDGDGVSNLDAYSAGTDPNNIQFYVEATNNYTSSRVIPLTITVQDGVPSKMAWLLDTTNTTTAIWKPYSTNIFVKIGLTEGWHTVNVGLKGLATNSIETWMPQSVYLDCTAPVIIITSPTNQTTARPIIQVSGTANEELSSVTYDLTNAAVGLSMQPGFVTQQHLNTNTLVSDSATFQCFDLPLTNGVNSITLHVMDLAGNSTITNFSVSLDYSSDTNAPAITKLWPTNGSYIGGSQISARGYVDDETASVTAQIVASDGTTNLYTAIVERNGRFWLDNLPLYADTNIVTITATDAGGNATITNIAYIKSAVTIQINTLADEDMKSSYTCMSGTISDTSYTLKINGAETTLDSSGNWSTPTNAPVYSGGGSTVDAIATKAGFPPVIQTLVQEAPAHFYYGHYQETWTQVYTNGSGFRSCVLSYDAHYDTNDQFRISGLKVLYENDTTQTTTNTRTWTDSWDENGATNVVVANYNGYISSATNADTIPPEIPAQSILQTDPIIAINHFYANHARLTSTDYGYIYTCSARSQPMLKTGGRSSKTWGVHTFALTNYKITGSTCIQEDSWSDCLGVVPPANETQVMGSPLDCDWALDVVLPDNICVCADIKSKGNHHSTDVTHSKTTPVITANGAVLNPDYIAQGAFFCVGEQIAFDVARLPSRRDEQATAVTWNLPGTFVNTCPDPITNTLYYEKDASLLTRISGRDHTLATSCWYVNKCEGTVTAIAFIVYPSGQLIKFNISGKIKVSEPLVQFTPNYRGTPTVMNTNGFLSVGCGASNQMSFYHTIRAPVGFSGKASHTQRAYGQISKTGALTGLQGDVVTITQWSLDNVIFPREIVDVADVGAVNVHFYDGPHTMLDRSSSGLLKVNYETYFMFKPNEGPGNNIYIPLRVVIWNVDGEVGSNRLTKDGVTKNPQSVITTEFPWWDAVWTN
jgi:hypothetical protein